MCIHTADAETIVDGFAILREMIIGDGILVTKLVFGLFYLTSLLNVRKLVLFSLGLASANAAYLGCTILDVFDFGLVGCLFGGDGDIVVGRVISEGIPGCDGEGVGGWVVGGEAMRGGMRVRVGEVVEGDGGLGWLWLLLLLELYL